MRNLFLYVGFRHLKYKPLRSVLTTLGVAFGVTLFVAIQLINKSVLISFQESMEAIAGKANLVVTQSSTGFPEDKIEALYKFKEIKSAVPMVQSSAYFSGESKITESLMILGVDMLKENSVRSYKTTDSEVMDDPLIFLNQPDSVIVTREFALRNKLSIDSKIEIATALGKKTLTVRGLLTPDGPAKAYGGALALMDIDGARVTFGKVGKSDRIDIVTRKDVDLDALSVKLSAELGSGFKVERPQENSLSMERLVKSYQVLLSFFSTLALLVGIFMVANTMGISVAERRREIGTLRALGAERFSISVLFVAEALMMGLLGSSLGLLMGRLLSTQLIGMVSRSMSAQYLTPIHGGKIYFSLSQALMGIGVGTLAAVVAALWPAFKAASVKPLEAMRKYEVVMGGGKNKLLGKGFWLGFILLIYLVIASFLDLGSKHYIFEIIAQGSTMLGSALVAPAIVNVFLHLLKIIFAKKQNALWNLPINNLLRFPKRTASNVTTLMIGLVLVIMVATLNRSFKDTLSAWFDRVLKADVLVSSNGQLFAYRVQALSEDLRYDIEKTPGLMKGPERSVYSLRFIHFNYNGKQLGLKAFDKPNPEFKYSILDMREGGTSDEVGRKLFESGENVITVSEIFAFHQKMKTGDVMKIETPTGPVDFKIVGVMIDFASPEGVIYMHRELYKKYWNDSLVDGFSFNMAPGFKVEDARRDIDARLGKEKNIMTISQKEMRSEIINEVDKSFAYTKAIEVAALLVAMLGLFNTFMISVMERTRELGMLRAVGMEKKQLKAMIIREALFQGGLGSVAAVLLGAGISYIFIKNNLANMLGWIVDFSFPASIVVSTILIGLCIGGLAAFYPAKKASDLEIRDALEYE